MLRVTSIPVVQQPSFQFLYNRAINVEVNTEYMCVIAHSFQQVYLWCNDMLGCDAHEDIVIARLKIITVRLLESLDIITE